MKSFRSLLRIFAVIIILVIAWMFRMRAVENLPVDFDEDDYLRASQEYMHLIRASNWSGFLETNYRPEHPPLTKIIMGIGLLSQPEEELVPDAPTTAGPNKYMPRNLLRQARMVNAVAGWLTVAMLAILDPLAGLALATHTFTIKYVSQVMLEAIPSLTSMLMILTYLQFKRSQRINWLAASALFLGLTASSKYLYCVPAVAILVDWFLTARNNNELRKFYKQAVMWGGLGLILFFATDPFLWPNPVQRLKESVLYHAAYSSSADEVQRSSYPIWQPFVWLTMSPVVWHENVFYVAPDFLILLFAIAGLKRLWHKERIYVLWIGFALLFLLYWPTKWPQYILMFTVPLSIAASEGIQQSWQSMKVWYAERKTRKIMYDKRQTRQAIPWLIPGLIAFAVLTLFPFLFQTAVSLTDFNSQSIRDGFQGGIWREVSGGLTGQIEPITPEFPFRGNKVKFTGLSGYLPIFGFITSNGMLVFNIIWAVFSTFLQLVLGLGLALLLNQKGVRFGRFWQIFFILPWAIPEFIGALLWLNIFVPDIGWLSLAAQKYGEAFPLQFLIGWQDTPNLRLLVFLIPAVWYGFPLIMLASNAGLKAIPIDVYEAAALDGANIWQTFRYVTLPLLMPLLIPAIIIRSIFAFNQFYLFQAFFFDNSTLATFSYNLFSPSSWGGGQFAVSAIVNIFTVLILIGFVVTFNRGLRSREEFRNA